ncbi:hypothetical protein A2765_03245 [Candidatus Kaiserbacteria bacterium RIFCSPHIGHO2_01_FULL_56_24]|uniref:Uncharacterized protein n=1 Tax=Candidatus Kaiserbacteria bacterium RIFCSPHIGHO2_01_FULL_56_24 TaxID=1798487 RepID=A0A1F6DDV4_9BACT|nr:MAG: hypothetical protein A2765_03245 [Candidatus Kaiserbacteria bacterium RIFCSPHIGHO2_01_FULL_56_24]
MSWASRRRFLYIFGFLLVVGSVTIIPLWIHFYKPGDCSDGKQNNAETAVDKGGDCRLLDERSLLPVTVVWTRTMPVRVPGQEQGSYSAVAYIENPNVNAGVMQAPYRFKLYDSENVLVAEVEGSTYVMPGTVTPVFEGGINTGHRKAARAYFEFTAPLVWERLYDATEPITVPTKDVVNATTEPRLNAVVKNGSVADLRNTQFVATIFDTAGNAFAGSATEVQFLERGKQQDVVFTWSEPFPYLPGRIDVLPVMKPLLKPR